jgi:hypothetical protein
MRTEEDREVFAGTGAYFQNTVAVVVAREDLLPAFEVSIGTTNSVPFLELPCVRERACVRARVRVRVRACVRTKKLRPSVALRRASCRGVSCSDNHRRVCHQSLCLSLRPIRRWL